MIKRIKHAELGQRYILSYKKKSKLSAKALSSHEKYKFAYNLAHISMQSSAELYWGSIHMMPKPLVWSVWSTAWSYHLKLAIWPNWIDNWIKICPPKATSSCDASIKYIKYCDTQHLPKGHRLKSLQWANMCPHERSGLSLEGAGPIEREQPIGAPAHCCHEGILAKGDQISRPSNVASDLGCFQ